MDISTLIPELMTILGVWVLAVLLPGPNFLATAHSSMAHSRRAGLACAMGVAFGTVIWAAGSLLGLGILFRSAAWLYHAIKYAGAAYLIYVGVKSLWSSRKATDQTTCSVEKPAGVTPPSRNGWQAFRYGLVVDLANPKAAAFFTSLFAVSVPPEAPLWFQAAVVLVVSGISAIWYSIVACIVDAPPVAAFLDRAQRGVKMVTGALFVALGLQLALED